jgi:DNA-binding response OmpR family regulator
MPVLILTAKDAVEAASRKRSVADDYLVKPFAFQIAGSGAGILRRPTVSRRLRGRPGTGPGAYRATRAGQRLDLTAFPRTHCCTPHWWGREVITRMLIAMGFMTFTTNM